MNKVQKKQNDWTGGLVLVGIGIYSLLNNYVNLSGFEHLFILGLGVLFLLLGCALHKNAALIPGGILTGIGAGIALTNGSSARFANDSDGVFLLTFAAGWALIFVTSKLFGTQTLRWPLIPATILGLIGGALAFGGIFDTLLQLIGNVWQVGLIILGIIMIIEHRKASVK